MFDSHLFSLLFYFLIKTTFQLFSKHIRPRSVDFTDGGFFSDLFNAVGRSKIKNKIKS